MHLAFDEVVDRAAARGMRVTGSELVGLVPLQAMLDAGRYFLLKQRRSVGVSDRELIKIAVHSLGLNDISPFDPEKRIIDYAIRDSSARRLVDMSIEDFVHETASESPAPGGGSISAAMGSFGAALATMVANLSAHKRGWDERWEEFSEWAERGKGYHDRLLELIDEDTAAFNALMAAFGMSKKSEEDQAARAAAIQDATRQAIEAPLAVMKVSLESMSVIRAMAEIGNPNSVSDAGVAALCARSAVMGAFLNVRINASGLDDKDYATRVTAEGEAMQVEAQRREAEILRIVEEKL
jgi:glutamate formiminotransferase / formiminotetrahydrofolate cyclodeaminase